MRVSHYLDERQTIPRSNFRDRWHQHFAYVAQARSPFRICVLTRASGG